MSNLEETLNLLKISYLKKLKETDVPSLLEKIKDKIEIETAMDIRGIIHKISGTGGMYGLKDISESSTICELYLNEIKNDNSKLNENILKEKVKDVINMITKANMEA